MTKDDLVTKYTTILKKPWNSVSSHIVTWVCYNDIQFVSKVVAEICYRNRLTAQVQFDKGLYIGKIARIKFQRVYE